MDNQSSRRSPALSAARAAPHEEGLNQQLRALALTAGHGTTEEERTTAFERMLRILDKPMQVTAESKLREWLGTGAFDLDDVDDITHSARIQLFRELPRYRPETEVLPWVVTIVRSQAIRFARWRDHLRTRSGIRMVHDNQAIEVTEAQQENPYLRHFIEGVVTRLTPDQRKVYHLVFVQGHSVAEAAEMIPRSKTWVRKRIKMLRAAFGDIR
jgi:RNA polymerase sigma factor (sigma-70 family)